MVEELGYLMEFLGNGRDALTIAAAPRLDDGSGEVTIKNEETTKMGNKIRALVLLAVMPGLGGCVFSIGGSNTSNTPTKGQQLIDLKTALDHGAITQQEYDQQKAQILAHQP